MLAGTSVARSHHVHIDHRSEVTEVIIPQIARDITKTEAKEKAAERTVVAEKNAAAQLKDGCMKLSELSSSNDGNRAVVRYV